MKPDTARVVGSNPDSKWWRRTDHANHQQRPASDRHALRQLIPMGLMVARQSALGNQPALMGPPWFTTC